MTSKRWIGARLAAALATACIAIAGPAAAQPAMPEPATLAGDLGCNACHAAEPAGSARHPAPPPAPSWREIAARYRGDAAAAERLAQVVAGGSGERHWKGRAGFESMLPQAPWVKPEEARALVRWILAHPG